MFQLNKLTSLVKKRKRIGRGGSRGGTSGKGHKGQKARSGAKIDPAFEGGQMPLLRRLPKRGFTNARFKRTYKIISLKQIDSAFEEGAVITRLELQEKGLVKFKKGQNNLLKILGDGSLSKKLTIEADAFSKAALKAIADVSGEARLTKEK